MAPTESDMANGKSATIQRNPTFPLSKRDSVASTASRISLISNGNPGCKSHTGTPKSTPGKSQSRVPPDRKWTESDFVNNNPNMISGMKRATSKRVRRTDSYRKATERQSELEDTFDVNSNPKKIVPVRGVDRTKYNTLPIKPGDAVKPVTKIDLNLPPLREASTGTISRTESQKSWRYYPSPDTDDDQLTVLPDRKKKSAFKRMKERLSRTFRKDRVSGSKSSGRRFEEKDGGATKASGDILAGKEAAIGKSSETKGVGASNKCSICGGLLTICKVSSSSSTTSTSKSKDGLLSTFRNSIRRKRSQKPQIVCSCPQSQSVSQSQSTSQSQSQSTSQSHVPVDPITETFTKLIQYPTNAIGTARPSRPQLRLEGLKKYAPASKRIDEPEDEADGRTGDLSPDVEIDGPMFPGEEDGATGGDKTQTTSLGTRLAAIGDRLEAKRRETSSSSESEAQSRPEFDHTEILHELREYADELDKDFFKKRAKEISVNIMPIIRNILAAKDFSCFQRAMRRELETFYGWDQVAWYTHLVKTAMYVAGNSHTLKGHATRYFNQTIKPWIRSRPNGWESIYEETDVDSEVD